MKSLASPNITKLFVAWKHRDQEALAQLTPLVYRELHGWCTVIWSESGVDIWLQTTAPVNEAFVQLID